jgi:tetratricopeptide (TPR) repeat protein
VKGNYEGAEERLEKAVDLGQKALGADHIYVAMALYSLGVVREDTCQWSKAADTYSECIRVTRHVGLEHPRAPMLIEAAGRVLPRLEKTDEANGYFREMRQAQRERWPNKDTIYIADSLAGYYLFLRDNKRKEAGDILEEALNCYRRLGKPSRIRCALVFHEMGISKERAARFSESESLFRDSLEIRKKLERTPTLDSLRTRNALARVLMSQGKYTAECEEYLAEVHREVERSHAKDYQEFRPYFYPNCCRFHLHLGRHAPAAADARQWLRDVAGDPDKLLDVARTFARCAEVARANSFLPLTETVLWDGYAREAIGVLDHAVRQGFKDRRRLENDPEFASFKGRPDFDRVLTRIPVEKPKS